jgi:D-methionine transport system ATP-binding protein
MAIGAERLSVKDLTKHFTTDDGVIRAVDGVSFRVNAGEIYGFIGLSGAGKSTLIRCINLLERPDKGTVIFDGVNMTKLDDKALIAQRRHIGMIFQHFNLFRQKTVFENIAYPLRLEGKKKHEIDRDVNELLGYVDLTDKSSAYPAELSGGQKQRVAIARALAMKPKLLLSDEGTSALDPETTQSILELLRRTVNDLGIAVVLITHQMEVAKVICDRIGVLEEGKLIEEGTVESLFVSPKQERTVRFIQSLADEPVDIGVEALNSGRLFRITYPDDAARRPIISDLIRTHNVDVNILAGNINALRKGKVGYLTVELVGDPEEIAAAIRFLSEQHINVEEV